MDDAARGILVSLNQHKYSIGTNREQDGRESRGQGAGQSTTLRETEEEWASTRFDGTYADAKAHASAFLVYKQKKKRERVVERQDVAALFGNVQTKLKTYRLREYVPPAGLTLAVRPL